ncbi:MAG: hypothetical protein HYW70_02360 [Candidatus Nealsonbacteria bacterium]|nr:hypothetical protein [Candidatus Nealsonbacteria bacterium]
MPAQLIFIFNTLWEIFKNWWWLAPPFLLYRPFLVLWLWWRQEVFSSQQKYVFLEIKIPKEVIRPLKAMEQAFHSIWGNIYDPPDWWEKWIEGKFLLRFSMEIAAIDGEPHFFMWVPEGRRNAIEASLYSQYSDVEISTADDYTKAVPREIPNKNWNMWGCDYELVKPDVYPIKTYAQFFEERPEAPVEEKRLDPISTLLEGMATLKAGEQLWVQIVAVPIVSVDDPSAGDNYVARGKVIVEKLLKRPPKEKPKSIFREALGVLITGKTPGEDEKEQSFFVPEMMLSPGERAVVAGIEDKISKYCFTSWIRFIYIAKSDVYFGGAKATPFGFFQQFSTSNLNALKPWSNTLTKIKKHWFLPINFIRERRLYLRKRQLFKTYISRLPPRFPHKPTMTFILNTEELATIFHFPGRAVSKAPFVERIETKKGEAPPGLPTE